jgi:hypothetical protein
MNELRLEHELRAKLEDAWAVGHSSLQEVPCSERSRTRRKTRAPSRATLIST